MLPAIWKNRGSLIGPNFDNFIESFFYGWPTTDKESDVLWSPRVDVSETDREILLEVELPGIDKKDIKIEIKDNTLYISGERNHEKKTDNTEVYRVERHYGKFERSFGLPETVDANKTAAKYKDGILELTLPKNEKAIPKQIAVEVK